MKGLKHSAAALGLVLATAGVALASDGGGEHHADWGNFAFRVANFVIFIGIIYWAAGKKIVGFFSGRRKGIEQELNDLESRKAEAAKNLADVERRIASLEQERQAILAEYRAQGEAMQAAIIEKAEKTASQIAEQAARTAENEIKQAMENMRAEMADQIIAAAEKMLQEKLTGEEHEKLIDKYLTKVVLN
ncbi:ATP synthase B/B' CF family protein [Desulfovibrio sp. A2]|nr:ATP synthase B/B' CF family protein [Desulfovibrio sp. A2]